MIPIVDSITQQASELSVSIQLNFYLNKQTNSVYVPNLIYITQQFVHS